MAGAEFGGPQALCCTGSSPSLLKLNRVTTIIVMMMMMMMIVVVVINAIAILFVVALCMAE